MNEIYDASAVKNEFLQNVGDEYLKVFTPQQMELAAYVLNDFCNNLAANNLALVRIDVEPPAPAPQQYQYQQPQYQMPPPPLPPQPTLPRQNPFGNEEAEVAQNIREMNAQLQQPPRQYRAPQQVSQEFNYPPLPPVPSDQDVNLQTEPKKTFTDKIREMRVGRKTDRINPEE